MAKEGLKTLVFFVDVPHFNNIGQHYGGTGALETGLIFHLPCNVKLCLSTHIHRSLGLFFFPPWATGTHAFLMAPRHMS